MQPNQAELFGFEDAYRNDLRFIPVAMRYRLDLAGLKIGLEAWLRIPVEERFALSALPIGNPADLESFHERLLRSAARFRSLILHGADAGRRWIYALHDD